MSDDKPRAVPKEGSNHIEHENGQKRSNISEALTVRHLEGSDQQSEKRDATARPKPV